MVLMERTNIRYLEPSAIRDPIDLIVIDVSFISLRLIIPPMMAVLKPGGGMVTLIKPQFEAGREQISKGGVVRDEAVRQQVVESIREFGLSIGLVWNGVCTSPITGPKGNVEHFLYARRTTLENHYPGIVDGVGPDGGSEASEGVDEGEHQSADPAEDKDP